VNRYRPAMLVVALVAAAALPQVVSAQGAAVGGVAGNVDLTVADVVTGGVQVASPTTATLTGTVDPNQVGTEYYFEYGPDGNLTFRTPTVSLGSTLDPRQITADVTGLQPGTPYDYRLVAANPGGVSVSRALSFQTGPGAVSGKKGKKSSCTIRGTSKRDVLRGTNKRDVICGLGGNDRIRGLRGNDVIRGGAGKDRVLAGAGKDRVFGNAGNDALYGQAGADRLYGGKGRDRVVGGPGRDRAKIDRRDTMRSVEQASRR
jgi:Ca2+-binding RTX toxin-like protein